MRHYLQTSIPGVISEDQYISDYEKHEGILLEADKIEVNPPRRSVAKILLNSLWGVYIITI